MGAYVVLAVSLWLSLRVRSRRPSAQAVSAAGAVAFLAVFQVLLGIVTLLTQAPLALAAAHQLTAALLFCACVWLAFEVNPVAVVIAGSARP